MPHIRVTCPADFVEFKRDAIFQGIHRRIEEQARVYPGNIALRTPDVAYTYAEMNIRANSIAAEILRVAGTELGRAAIVQPNRPEMIISMLATLKAHKAYVPLDPNFPQDRLKIMVEDAEPVVLLTDDANLALAEELANKRVRIVNVSRIAQDTGAPNPNVPGDAMDLAYILYTSGSTGRPKGIAFLHRNLVHHTMGLVNRLCFSPSDRVTWLHSSSFAASIVDIYCCLMAGGTLYPWDVKTQGFTGLADWLVQQKITTFQWIPSAFRQFLRTVPHDFVFGDIRIVVMASESLTVREVELFRRHFRAGSHLVNQLGTSEAGNYRLFLVDHQTPIEGPHVPGGYPPSDDRVVVILGDENKKLPPGSVGQIGVQSDYMCGGYWRDEVLTQSKFVRIDAGGPPVYLTGDMGRLEPDGCLTHLGRMDFQVKIRGHRVELAEVEQVLAAAPGVADAAAWIVKNHLGEDQLVAYIVPEDAGAPDHPAVQRYMESRLPEYMVPRHYMVLDRLPSLPTGKTDRKGLPNPFDRVKAPTVAPGRTETSISQEVTSLFEELLQMEGIADDSNLMEAGGDSLLSAVLLERIRQRFRVAIPVDDFLESATPAHLASLVARALQTKGGRPTVREPAAKRSHVVIPPQRAAHVAPHRNRPGAQGSSAIGNLIIISAGGFGREVHHWATQAIAAGAPYRIKGFLDNRPGALAGFDYPAGILDMDSYSIQDDDVFVGALGDPKDKIEYYSPIVEKGGRFVNLIHPLANVAGNARLGSGIVVGPFSAINADVTVGDHVAIGTFSNVGHDATIGNWCHVASHCGVNGRATIGTAVFLGSHSCVIPGVTVGDSAFVGAGSVVVRDVQPGVKVFGNPAAPIGAV